MSHAGDATETGTGSEVEFDIGASLPPLTEQTILTSFNLGGTSSGLNNIITVTSSFGSLGVNAVNNFVNTQQYGTDGSTVGTSSTSMSVTTGDWYHLGITADSATGTGSLTIVNNQGDIVDTTSVPIDTVFPAAVDMTALTLGSTGNDVTIQHDQTVIVDEALTPEEIVAQVQTFTTGGDAGTGNIVGVIDHDSSDPTLEVVDPTTGDHTEVTGDVTGTPDCVIKLERMVLVVFIERLS